MEQIFFDFTNKYSESVSILEGHILFTSGRAHLPFYEPETELLTVMLQTEAVVVFKNKYPYGIDYPDEIANKASAAEMYLPNRRSNYPIQSALSLFAPYEPEPIRNSHNALFFPDMKAFVRFGDLQPSKLLTMLGESGCDKVCVFPYACESATEDAYYSFERRIPKEQFDTVMKKLQDLQADRLTQALYEANKKHENIIPDIPTNGLPDD